MGCRILASALNHPRLPDAKSLLEMKQMNSDKTYRMLTPCFTYTHSYARPERMARPLSNVSF